MTPEEIIQCLENKIKYQQKQQEQSLLLIARETAFVSRSRASVISLKHDIELFKAQQTERAK